MGPPFSAEVFLVRSLTRSRLAPMSLAQEFCSRSAIRDGGHRAWHYLDRPSQSLSTERAGERCQRQDKDPAASVNADLKAIWTAVSAAEPILHLIL
jgi:hypothetical protein